MPLYRFSTTYGDTIFDKGDALEFEDDSAAWEEATIACGEILKGLDGSLTPDRDWRMDVHDAAGNKVFTLRLTSEKHR